MAANPKEEGPVEKAVIQAQIKLDVLTELIRNLRVDIAYIPKSNAALWLFAAFNFIINCAVLIVLYMNLNPTP